MTSSGAKVKESRKGQPAFIAAVIALTLLHLGIRVAISRNTAESTVVSSLERGDHVELPELQPHFAVAPSSPACDMVVAFSPSCPFCDRAAKREHQAKRGSYSSPLWLTDEATPGLEDFVARLAKGSTPVVSGAAVHELHVHAVPALFLLDAEGTVRWVGPYKGDESDEKLAERCTAEVMAGPGPRRSGELATWGLSGCMGRFANAIWRRLILPILFI